MYGRIPGVAKLVLLASSTCSSRPSSLQATKASPSFLLSFLCPFSLHQTCLRCFSCSAIYCYAPPSPFFLLSKTTTTTTFYHLTRHAARAGHRPPGNAMATSARSCSSGLLLVFLLAVCAASDSGERVRVTPTVIGCYPAATNDSGANATAFRASLLPLLGALPSAAAPTGFASLRSDRALARGVCFGDATPSDCLACLSVAAKNLTDGCGAATTRLAGVWNDGCFVSYADTVAPSVTTLVSTALVPRSEPSDPNDSNDSNGFINLTLGLLYALVAMQFVNLMLTIANVFN